MALTGVPNPFTRPGCRAELETLQDLNIDADDKETAEAAFRRALVSGHESLFAEGGSADNTFTIRPKWLRWEPGQLVMGYADDQTPAEAIVEVDVLSPKGYLVDRVTTVTTVVPDLLVSRTEGIRMRSALGKAGSAINRYLSDRWTCAH